MLSILDFLTFGILLFFVIRGLKRLFRTRTVRSADLICFMIFLFYGMPLVYDHLYQWVPPDWFYASWTSPRVRFLYDVLLLSAVLLIQLGARTKSTEKVTYQNREFTKAPLQAGGFVTFLTTLAWLVLLLPVPVVLLLSPEPSAYLGYFRAVSEARAASRSFAAVHNFVSFICLASLGAFFLIYWVRTRQTRTSWDIIRWLAVLLAMVAVFIHSKRTAIAFFLGIILMVNFLEHRLRFSTILLYSIVIIIGFYFYAFYLKATSRSPFEYVRSDLSRDYTLRYAIYRSGKTKNPIVPYRGSTYVFVMTAYVPRAVWPGKPWPAPVYFTHDVFGWTSSEYIGWGFGFGFMEELILNFGYVGILGCFFIGRFSRWLDKFIYERSSYYAVLWLPLVFSVIFASSVVLKLVMMMVIPVFLFQKVFAGPGSWQPLDSYGYDAPNSQTVYRAAGDDQDYDYSYLNQ